MSVLHIDLWKCYISYVKDTKAALPSYRCVYWGGGGGENTICRVHAIVGGKLPGVNIG